MKIGVVIVTHYRLGEEFLQALRLIVPDAPPFRRVSASSRPNPSRRCAGAISDALDARRSRGRACWC